MIVFSRVDSLKEKNCRHYVTQSSFYRRHRQGGGKKGLTDNEYRICIDYFVVDYIRSDPPPPSGRRNIAVRS